VEKRHLLQKLKTNCAISRYSRRKKKPNFRTALRSGSLGVEALTIPPEATEVGTL